MLVLIAEGWTRCCMTIIDLPILTKLCQAKTHLSHYAEEDYEQKPLPGDGVPEKRHQLEGDLRRKLNLPLSSLKGDVGSRR